MFLAGYIADVYPDCLTFLHDTVSRYESWKVQEILAMAFDNYCAKIGYENALCFTFAALCSLCDASEYTSF